MTQHEAQTMFEAIGGEETIRKLVEAFYPKVYADPDLAPIFPGNMEEIMHKQFLFLHQFTGGPPLYTQQFGAPMMRFRHLKFEITPRRAKAWLRCMSEAMDDIGLEGYPRQAFFERLTQVSGYMVNTDDEGNRIEE